MKVRYQCTECEEFTSIEMGKLVDHLREMHGGEPELKWVDVRTPTRRPT